MEIMLCIFVLYWVVSQKTVKHAERFFSLIIRIHFWHCAHFSLQCHSFTVQFTSWACSSESFWHFSSVVCFTVQSSGVWEVANQSPRSSYLFVVHHAATIQKLSLSSTVYTQSIHRVDIQFWVYTQNIDTDSIHTEYTCTCTVKSWAAWTSFASHCQHFHYSKCGIGCQSICG